MKQIILLVLLAMLLPVSQAAEQPQRTKAVSTHTATQAEEIQAILRELEYLHEVAAELAKKHAADKSRIRFNYAALIQQLKATENGIRAYLNAKIDEIHTTPPQPVNTRLFQVRQN